MLMGISLFWTSIKDGNKTIWTKYVSFIQLFFGPFTKVCAIHCDLYLVWAGEFQLIQKVT